MAFSLFKKKEAKPEAKQTFKTDVVFANQEEQTGFQLQNQEQTLTDFRDVDIEDFLRDMFVTPDQFVILDAPKAQHGIRFVQATAVGGMIDLELALEKEDGTRMVCKDCTQEECYEAFLAFYDGTFVPDMGEYEPVRFL